MPSVPKSKNGRSSKSLLDAATDALYAEYGRTSTDEQVDAGTIQNQRDFLSNYRDLYKLPCAGQYYDDGVSGMVPLGERPEGRRLLEDARAGKFKVLLVYRLDRLGRNLKSLLDALEELDAFLKEAYRTRGRPEAWRMVREEHGHFESQTMREEALAWLERWL